MVPCCHTNSLMVSSLVLYSSTVGVVAWSVAFCTCSGFASLSTHCAMALVWTPILFSVDIPFLRNFVCPLLSLGCVSFFLCFGLNSLGCCLQPFSLVAQGQLFVLVAQGQLSVFGLFSVLVFSAVNVWTRGGPVLLFWDNLLAALIGLCVWRFGRKCQL